MPLQPYSHPPITEAVIEIRFAGVVDHRRLGRVSSALAPRYPGVQILENRQVQLDISDPSKQPTAQVAAGARLYRRASSSETELALIAPTSLIISQLADYAGWDLFFERFKEDWNHWKRVVGYEKIARTGMRYINRLDLPAGGTIVDQEQYLNFSVRSPEALGPTIQYGAQAIFRSDAVSGLITINTGVMPSLLEDHLSIMLDIDLGRDRDVPQNDPDLFALLQEFRQEKNRVFESCITDRARELFRR
jgi:uncharacterized protein (TIGR04255 family)